MRLIDADKLVSELCDMDYVYFLKQSDEPHYKADLVHELIDKQPTVEIEISIPGILAEGVKR